MAPAEAKKIVAQRLGQIAHFAIGIDAQGAVTLRQLGSVGAVDQRHVRELGRVPAERAIDLGLAEGVGEMVVAADDVGDRHVVIVDDDGEVVGRRAVGAQDDEVVELLVRHRDRALDAVVDDGLALARRLEAGSPARRSGGTSPAVAVAPAAVIKRVRPSARGRSRIASSSSGVQ